MNLPRVKRVYDPPAAEDGCRVLVDRLWPRGVSKEHAAIHKWLREIAPSTALRKWYQHDATKWDEFRRCYFEELTDRPAVVEELLRTCMSGPVTLLYSSRENKLNNATALRDYLQAKIGEATD